MSKTTLDEAINKFRDYAQGKGGFDELDLKEVIVDDREAAIKKLLDRIRDEYYEGDDSLDTLLDKKLAELDDISLCSNGCHCMTHTVEGRCGKCGGDK